MSERMDDKARGFHLGALPHVCPPPLTPAAQAVLDAAVKWCEVLERPWGQLMTNDWHIAEQALLTAIRQYRVNE